MSALLTSNWPSVRKTVVFISNKKVKQGDDWSNKSEQFRHKEQTSPPCDEMRENNTNN